MTRRGSFNDIRKRRLDNSSLLHEVSPDNPPVAADDNRYIYRFNDANEWAPAIEAIRAEYVARRDGDPLDFICRNQPGQDTILHFGMENVYLLGFTVNGRTYEYGKRGKSFHELPGSTFLGYGSAYIDLGVPYSFTVVKIGYWALKQALMEIIKGGHLDNDDAIKKWIHDIRFLMPTILVMIPESVRFKWHYLTIRQLMLECEQSPVDVYATDWMGFGIRNWEKASRVAIGRGDRTTNQPPPGVDHVYTEDDMVTALGDGITLGDWVWASDLVVIPCIIKLEPVRVIERERRRSEGNRNESFIRVLWNNAEVNWQKESIIRQDFPAFDTRVTPPPAALPEAPAGLPEAPAGGI